MVAVVAEAKTMSKREFSQNLRWLNYWVRKANELSRRASNLNAINFELSPGHKFAFNRIKSELLRLDSERAYGRAWVFAKRLDGVGIYITGTVTVTEEKFGGGTPGVYGSGRWYTESYSFEVTHSPRILEVSIGLSQFFGYEITYWVDYNGHPAQFRLDPFSKTKIEPRIPQPTS